MAKKEKDGSGESFREKLCRRLDIVPDLLPGEGTVEIRGRSAVSVEGGSKILTYTPNEIRIALKRGSVCIFGDRLICTSYFVGSVTVEGRITGVSFEEGE